MLLQGRTLVLFIFASPSAQLSIQHTKSTEYMLVDHRVLKMLACFNIQVYSNAPTCSLFKNNPIFFGGWLFQIYIVFFFNLYYLFCIFNVICIPFYDTGLSRYQNMCLNYLVSFSLFVMASCIEQICKNSFERMNELTKPSGRCLCFDI